MYSPKEKIKYLLALVFFSNLSFLCLSDTVYGACSVDRDVKDTLKVQAKDTVARQVPDSVLYKERAFKAEELVRGERLFYGLVYLRRESVNCAACHNTVEI